MNIFKAYDPNFSLRRSTRPFPTDQIPLTWVQAPSIDIHGLRKHNQQLQKMTVSKHVESQPSALLTREENQVPFTLSLSLILSHAFSNCEFSYHNRFSLLWLIYWPWILEGSPKKMLYLLIRWCRDWWGTDVRPLAPPLYRSRTPTAPALTRFWAPPYQIWL